MSFAPLTMRLSAVKQSHDATVTQIVKDLITCRRQREELEAELQEAQRRLDTLRVQERELQETFTVQETQHMGVQLQAAIDTLTESLAELFRSQPYWIERSLLEQQRDELLKQDAALLSKIEAYRKVETNSEQYLSTLPEEIRPAIAQALQSEKERIRSQITPFLAAEERLGSWHLEQPLPLQVLVTYQEEHELIHWVIPFPADPTALSQQGGPTLVALADLLLTSLSSFGKHAGWSVDNLEIGNWEGYTTLTMLARFTQSDPIEQAARDLLDDLLRALPLLRGVTLDLHISQLPYATWQLGRSGVTLPTEISTHPEAEEEGLALSEVNEGWYTDEDVRSWLRTKESRLSKQGRRLRTLLVRLIGRGVVGGQPVSIEQLCRPLPPRHAEEMQQGVAGLLKAGVLLSPEKDNVTVNPAMLPEIQNLINRDPSEFWSTITGVPSAAQQ